jgi:hypothetical protein
VSNESPRQRRYVWAVASAGTFAVLLSVRDLVLRPVGYEWTILAVLTAFCGAATLRMKSVAASLSVGDTVSFAAVLLFGPAAGAMMVAIDALAISLRLAGRNLEPRRLIFNATAPAFAMWVAASMLYALVDVPTVIRHSELFLSLVLPLAAAAALYFVLNTGLVAIAIALETAAPPFEVWRTNFSYLAINFFGSGYAASLLVGCFAAVDLTLLTYMALVLGFFYYYANAFHGGALAPSGEGAATGQM